MSSFLSDWYLIFVSIGLCLSIYSFILSTITSKKLRNFSTIEFKYIWGSISKINGRYSFNFFNIYIKDEHIYLVPFFTTNPFASKILSNAIYFNGKETQIINDIYFDSSNHLNIEYVPFDTLSLLSRSDLTIKIKNLNSQQKNILAEYIEKHVTL